ncbi:MAG: succinylglutamate desuccinylase/aspartoacylase family protein [Halolamina sp.]|uniref:succinylglutamate desuccinylase/aspartoacylase family protein n=1 Tax=Halolamina sp. TaxID=1940283 RepID=UPI002FC340C6
MELGTASATRGELSRGHLTVTELPTGTEERLPVCIAQGEEAGPTLWVTASVHGDEITGMAVAQDLLTDSLPEELSGTLVVMPNLNPAGLRRNARTSYYGDDDPNRYFPDGEHKPEERARPPEIQERINRRLYDEIVETADAAVNLHTAGIGSRPFLIRGRVPYGDRRDEEAAQGVADELEDMVQAFGVPVVNQYAQEEYEELGLNRALSPALRDLEGIPAFTPELGSHSVVDELNRRAGVTGVRNVMRSLGMLSGEPEPNEAAPEEPVQFPVRRHRGPRTETPGIVRHLVDAGDVVEPGTPVAEIVTPLGAVKTTVKAEHDGYVVGRMEGGVAYEGDPLLSLAVRDESELVVPADGENGDAESGDDESGDGEGDGENSDGETGG